MRSLRARGIERASLPPWIPVGLAVLAALLGGRALSRSASERGVAVVDALRYRVHRRGEWWHPSWSARPEGVLGGVRELSADPGGVRDLRSRLERLSFVAETGPPEFLWPDGLSVPLRLREPVACLRAGDEYLPVAADGTVLDGFEHAPHEAHGAWLPVLADDPTPSEPSLRPGDVVAAPHLLDALSVAASMWESMPPERVAELGRVLIDARRSRAPDGLPGGIVLDLEGRRRVLFGRAPGSGHLGELPAELKWDGVRLALDTQRAGAPWDLFDARWDEPTAFVRVEERALEGDAHVGQ